MKPRWRARTVTAHTATAARHQCWRALSRSRAPRQIAARPDEWRPSDWPGATGAAAVSRTRTQGGQPLVDSLDHHLLRQRVADVQQLLVCGAVRQQETVLIPHRHAPHEPRPRYVRLHHLSGWWNQTPGIVVSPPVEQRRCAGSPPGRSARIIRPKPHRNVVRKLSLEDAVEVLARSDGNKAVGVREVGEYAAQRHQWRHLCIIAHVRAVSSRKARPPATEAHPTSLLFSKWRRWAMMTLSR